MLLISDSVQTAEQTDELLGSTAEIAGSERRRGLRIRQNRPVKVYEPTTSRYFGGQTEDISATGLRVELPAYAPVRVGEVLNIHVGLSQSGQCLANRRAMVPARVVWVNRARRIDGKLETGVEFLSSISAHLDAA
jgi:c-di-GMP-binding flagellar brake protein YcgR